MVVDENSDTMVVGEEAEHEFVKVFVEGKAKQSKEEEEHDQSTTNLGFELVFLKLKLKVTLIFLRD